jgi:hypothetical protein
VPAALVRVVVELVVELVVDFAEAIPVVPGRRVPVAGAVVRFEAAGPAIAFFSTTAFGEVGVEETAVSDVGADSGASVRWTTSKPSVSDMMGFVGKTVVAIGRIGQSNSYRRLANKFIPCLLESLLFPDRSTGIGSCQPAEDALQDAWTGLGLTKTVKRKQQQASQGKMSRNNAHRRAVF